MSPASEKARQGLRLLVVEEAVLLRRLLAETLDAWPQVGQVITAATASIAISRLERHPVDAALVDLAGEAGEGLKALRLIHRRHPQLPLLALGEMDAAGAVTAVRALQHGALEVLPRPAEKGDPAGLANFRSALGGLLLGLKLKRATNRARSLLSSAQETAAAATAAAPPPAEAAPPLPAAEAAEGELRVVAIGVSTGGPNALRRLIPRLPADLGAPVLVVQHMPPNFTRALADNLDRESALTVREAQEGDVPLPGHVYIAPGGRHLLARLERGGGRDSVRLGLSDDPPVNSCRPSVDVLFRSLAPVYGGGVLMVIMTGMGNDGLAGVAQLKALGGHCLTQSEESCVVYGMPRAVDEAGLSDERPSLDGLAARIRDLLSARPGKRGAS